MAEGAFLVFSSPSHHLVHRHLITLRHLNSFQPDWGARHGLFPWKRATSRSPGEVDSTGYLILVLGYNQARATSSSTAAVVVHDTELTEPLTAPARPLHRRRMSNRNLVGFLKYRTSGWCSQLGEHLGAGRGILGAATRGVSFCGMVDFVFSSFGSRGCSFPIWSGSSGLCFPRSAILYWGSERYRQRGRRGGLYKMGWISHMAGLIFCYSGCFVLLSVRFGIRWDERHCTPLHGMGEGGRLGTHYTGHYTRT